MLTARRAQRKEYAPVQAELSSEIFHYQRRYFILSTS